MGFLDDERHGPPAWDVFFSYRRSTAGPHVVRVHGALVDAGLRVFLDDREIPPDSEFPSEIADALLSSRVLVAFLDADYFKSQWCLYELQLALAPLRRDPSADASHVLAVLLAGDPNEIVAHLPPSLARSSLTGAEPDVVLRRVRTRLKEVQGSMAQRIGANDEALRALRLGGASPPAEILSRVPGFRQTMPRSLQERFRGRAIDLWAIFHELATVTPDAAPRSCCVCGPPGMGKSQLVAEFAWRYGRRHFPGGIVWIDAGATDSVERQIQDAVVGLSEPGGEAAPAGHIIRVAAASGRVLWIVDGIRPPSGGEPRRLEQWCPFRSDVTLLCTSRGARPVDVDVTIDLASLSESAAVDLLTGPGVRRDRLDAAGWASIARWVGCVPQALEIQYAVLKSGFREPRELLALAERRVDAVAEIDTQFAELKRELPTGSIAGISETFDIWYEDLKTEPSMRDAAHLLARSHASPLGADLVSRALLVKLAHRSWVQRIDRRDGTEDAGDAWRMNDLVRSYLLARSPDPSLEVVRLACAYLGFAPGEKATMVGQPRGGLDLLSNVGSLAPLSLEEVALGVLERALSRPNDLGLAIAAELLGALRNEPAATRLVRDLQAPTEATWPVTLYLRYIQGYARPPLTPEILQNEGGKLVIAYESLRHPPLSAEQTASLAAPLLRVLSAHSDAMAMQAAVDMARIRETAREVERELLRQLRTSPARAFLLAGAIVTAEVESVVARAVTVLAGEFMELETRIECLSEAVKQMPSLLIARVGLARLLVEREAPADAQAPAVPADGAADKRIHVGTLSVAIPVDWAHEVTQAEGRLTFTASPSVVSRLPCANLVVKVVPAPECGLDHTVADYLSFMSVLSPLEDLSLRYFRSQPASFFVSYGMRVEGRRARQFTRVLRSGGQEISATVTHLELHAVAPETIEAIERILFSVEPSDPGAD